MAAWAFGRGAWTRHPHQKQKQEAGCMPLSTQAGGTAVHGEHLLSAVCVATYAYSDKYSK